MTIDPSVQPGNFAGRQPISQDEVINLRRQIWSDGQVTPEEAAKLFELNDGAAPDSDWSDFFVEAMCDYLIARGQPRGYVTEADANWLIHHVGHDGRLDSHAELELIVKLLEKADYVPETLKQFALSEIEQTILTGSGPTRQGGEILPGRIDDAEVKLLRRLIFAPAGDGPARVGRLEADMLFRLKDATLGADNSSDWQLLFVQGVANHLMPHQSYVAPSPEEAERLATSRRPDAFNNLLAQIGRNPPSIREALFGDDEAERIAAHDRAVAQDASISVEEAAWLKHLFDKDGTHDPLEQALLDFLAEDGARPF